MADKVPVENRAELPAIEFDVLACLLEQQTTMERALAWFSGQAPKLAPNDLVIQDEFSFDLLVPYRDGLYLCYDIS
jgi:hypothetical protein